MYRYFIRLSYNGTLYHGWQLQPNAVSVQEILTNAFSKLLSEQIAPVTGCGRTDAGVHARNFVAHIDLQKEIADIPTLLFRMNHFLPPDIVIHQIKPVDAEMHSRFSAFRRTYHYLIITEKDPFRQDLAYRYSYSLDLDKMNEAAELLMSHTDFASFSRLHGGNKTTFCKLTEAKWTQEGTTILFTITADRFLRNMVRAIVGTLIQVGLGKCSMEQLEEIIQSKDRCRAGQSAPARGLFLMHIQYPDFTW